MKAILDTLQRKWAEYIMEILVIIIGILGAFALDSWNEERKNRIKEKEVLLDILVNIERNNMLIQRSLAEMDKFDESTDIILGALNSDFPYTDSLGRHFFASSRTGGLMFPLSLEGYESLKNAGFDVIRSKLVKDKILTLFETSYERLKTKASWTMMYSADDWNYLNMIFSMPAVVEMVPINYDELKTDHRFIGMTEYAKFSLRRFLRRDAEHCLHEGQDLLQIINQELGEE